MGALDIITQMKSQGKSDSEIIQVLQGQGLPPKEIRDALSQAQIKMAVSGGSETENMQESIMDNPPIPQGQDAQDYSYGQEYDPQQPAEYSQTQDPYSYNQGYPQQDQYSQDAYSGGYSNYNQQDPYTQQDQYSQDAYSGGYSSGSYSGGTDSGTLIEISEQVFSEKVKKVQDTIDTLNEFKTLTDAKVKIMEERLKRIESTIDQLQISILDKVGNYGQNLSTIKKEMTMMQDSFGKVINPLLDRKRKRL